jgi:hypothetical protein
VGSFGGINVKVFVNEYRAAHPRNPDGPLAEMVLVDGLGHQAMDRAVVASRAEMKGNIPQRLGSFKYLLHIES